MTSNSLRTTRAIRLGLAGSPAEWWQVERRDTAVLFAAMAGVG